MELHGQNGHLEELCGLHELYGSSFLVWLRYWSTVWPLSLLLVMLLVLPAPPEAEPLFAAMRLGMTGRRWRRLVTVTTQTIGRVCAHIYRIVWTERSLGRARWPVRVVRIFLLGLVAVSVNSVAAVVAIGVVGLIAAIGVVGLVAAVRAVSASSTTSR